MHGLRLLIIVIGALLASLASAEVENSDVTMGDDGYPPRGIVVVEPGGGELYRTKDGKSEARPYLERRTRWGTTFSLGYSTYEPVKFVPSKLGSAELDYGDVPTFNDVYAHAEFPTMEFQFDVKRNFAGSSLAVEIAGAYYRNDADRKEVASTLTLIPIRLGATYTIDNLFARPYLVPYASLGAYVVRYKEEGTEDTTEATSAVAPYLNLGAQFSLDWIDPRSAQNAYDDAGLEGTYVFLEMRKLFASSQGDQDLSNNLSFGGGLKLEF